MGPGSAASLGRERRGFSSPTYVRNFFSVRASKNRRSLTNFRNPGRIVRKRGERFKANGKVWRPRPITHSPHPYKRPQPARLLAAAGSKILFRWHTASGPFRALLRQNSILRSDHLAKKKKKSPWMIRKRSVPRKEPTTSMPLSRQRVKKPHRGSPRLPGKAPGARGLRAQGGQPAASFGAKPPGRAGKPACLCLQRSELTDGQPHTPAVGPPRITTRRTFGAIRELQGEAARATDRPA